MQAAHLPCGEYQTQRQARMGMQPSPPDWLRGGPRAHCLFFRSILGHKIAKAMKTAAEERDDVTKYYFCLLCIRLPELLYWHRLLGFVCLTFGAEG